MATVAKASRNAQDTPVRAVCTQAPHPMNRASSLVSFLNSSPSPHHAVETAKQTLLKAGFTQLFEHDSWESKVKPAGKYFITRNGTSILALAVENKFNVDAGQFKIVAAHTDSPCLRVKPVSQKSPKEGFLQVGVETYGGGLWHTWFDRDLSVAGKIVANEGTTDNPILREHLVNVKKPILRIPSLAIHLDRSVHEAFKFNNETHLAPILCTDRGDKPAEGVPLSHHQELLEAICAGSDRLAEQVVSVDLCLYETQPAVIGGARNEFIFSARLDNLYMAHCTLQALIESSERGLDGTGIRMAILFDHEEVGSQSAHGADSNIVHVIMRRLIHALASGQSDALARMISRSLLVSADMAHAVHPNYGEKHEECHRPRMHKGLVIKHNSNQRYATTARTAAIVKALARREKIPVQEFMVRNDSPCGSTIGPILSAKLGIPAVDVGVAQLSMHSIREMAGTEDVDNSVALFTALFSQWKLELNVHNP